MKKKLEDILKYAKTIFLIGILILIVYEIAKLRKEISVTDLRMIMESVGIFKLLIICIFAFVAISPMLNYDFLFSKMLGDDRDKKYILERSITINTFNNLIGFGGLVNIGLRAQYFEPEDKKGGFAKLIVKSFLFYFTGCSFLAMVGLVYAIFAKDTNILKFWPVLVGGMAYFPLAFGISKYKNNDDIRFSRDFAIKFSLTSVLEWSGAFLTFLLIGFILGIKLNFFRLLAIFIISNLTGIISMIPGGLGSFDLLALRLLTSYGINKELVLSWLLLYRLFYYVIPFFLGLIFFIKNSENILIKAKDEIGAKLAKSLSLDLLVILLYILGVFFIFSVTIPDELSKIEWISKFGHLQGNLIYQFPSVVFGCLYIFLGLANKKKVKRAFLPTMVVLFLGLVYAKITKFSLYTMTYIIFCMVLAYISKNLLYKNQLVYSYENKTRLTLLLALISLISIIFFTKNYQIIKINRLNEFVIMPYDVPLFKILAFLLVLWACIYILNLYLRGKKERIGQKVDFSIIDYLLQTYPSTTSAGLAYLGDKDIFYAKDEEGNIRSALQFYTYKDKLVVMGDPFGDPYYYEDLIKNFIKEADLYDYNPIFYEISEDYIMKLHDYGYGFMKFGESASVRVEEFSLEGKKNKSFRNVVNKFDKANISFEVVSPPHDLALMAQMRTLSDKWLDGRKEMGFSIGFFDEAYLQKCKLALVRQEDGSLIAFANLMPDENCPMATIDLMRFDPARSPNGAMDFLFINLFLYCKSIGKEAFDLGMAPLYNVGVNENSFLEEKLAFLVYKFGDRFYSFEGLRNYKRKFASLWVPVYTSYSKKTWLFYLVLILFKVERLAPKKLES